MIAPAPQRGFGSSGPRLKSALAAGYHTRCPWGHAFVEWRSPVCLPTCRSTIVRKIYRGCRRLVWPSRAS